MSGGEFDWGGRLLKGIGGAQRFPQNGWKPFEECKGRRELDFYPKEVQDRAIELGLIDRNTMNRKRKCFMIPFFIVMLAALVLIIGLWNEASSFGEAYWQALQKTGS